MNIVSVASHSVDVELLTKGGWVLDAGCRDFKFSKEMVSLGCKVLSLDPDPEAVPGTDEVLEKNINFVPKGLAAAAGKDRLFLMENVEMRHLGAAGYTQWHGTASVEIETVSPSDLMKEHKIEMWDCIKMDIEGSEYEILLKWPGPIAKQITLEWHDHLSEKPPEMLEQIYAHLGQWYDVVYKHPQDTLFVLRPESEFRALPKPVVKPATVPAPAPVSKDELLRQLIESGKLTKEQLEILK